MAATLAASVAESLYSRLNGRRMTHEQDLAPKKLLKRFAPESFDIIARLASPVLPSGKRVGYLLNAVALAVLVASLWAGYYLLESGSSELSPYWSRSYWRSSGYSFCSRLGDRTPAGSIVIFIRRLGESMFKLNAFIVVILALSAEHSRHGRAEPGRQDCAEYYRRADL